jgi:brefeldin A-inhibited guanine nucleotide-exchange protein
MLSQTFEKLSLNAKQQDLRDKLEQKMSQISAETSGDFCWDMLAMSILNPELRILGLGSVEKLVAHQILGGTLVLRSESQVDEIAQRKKEELDESNLVDRNVRSYEDLKSGSTFKDFKGDYTVVDDIIMTVWKIQNDDPEIQLQTLKLLLTLVTSEKTEIHSFSLILVFKLCFYIHCSSATKSTNENTAKASLTQMVNLVFAKLEKFGILHHDLIQSITDQEGAQISTSTPNMNNQNSESVPDLKEDEERLAEEPAETETDVEKDFADSGTGNTETVVGEEAQSNELASANLNVNESKSDIEVPLDESEKEGTNADENITQPKENDSDDNNKQIFADRQKILIEYQQLKTDIGATLKFLSQQAVAHDSGTVPVGSEISLAAEINAVDEPTEANAKDRTLALELIVSIFNNLGTEFRRCEEFVSIIKSGICPAVSRNSVTTMPNLFELSLSVYLLLTRHFRNKLKLEIEVQLVMYLQILEMSNSTYKQKSIILQGLSKLCENPQV